MIAVEHLVKEAVTQTQCMKAGDESGLYADDEQMFRSYCLNMGVDDDALMEYAHMYVRHNMSTFDPLPELEDPHDFVTTLVSFVMRSVLVGLALGRSNPI